MTDQTTPSPQPAGAGGEQARRYVQQLSRIQREQAGWANRIGQPGCAARLDAADNAEALAWAVKALSAPQAQPDARAVEGAKSALLCAREDILGLVNARWSEAEGTEEDWIGHIDAALQALSAPAADDGWRPSREDVARIIDEAPDDWTADEVAEIILALQPAAPTDAEERS